MERTTDVEIRFNRVAMAFYNDIFLRSLKITNHAYDWIEHPLSKGIQYNI